LYPWGIAFGGVHLKRCDANSGFELAKASALKKYAKFRHTAQTQKRLTARSGYIRSNQNRTVFERPIEPITLKLCVPLTGHPKLQGRGRTTKTTRETGKAKIHMPRIDLVKKTSISASGRARQLAGMFDVPRKKISVIEFIDPVVSLCVASLHE
jgi:hypothetical protein